MREDGVREVTTGVVDVSGARLPFRVEGQGIPTIVLSSSVYYPRTYSLNLRQHLHMAFVDLRHWVPSDPDLDVDQITLDTYADDIDRIRHALDWERVLVMGHSIHGNIALEYARRYAKYVLGVVVIGSPPVMGEKMDLAFEDYWESNASQERKRMLESNFSTLEPELEHLSSGEQFVRSYVARGPSLWYDPTYDCTWLWEGVEVNVPVFERLGSLFAHYDLAEESPAIHVPVLVILGKYDFAAPAIWWEERKGVVPDAEYHVFDRSGHTPQLEEPQRFDSALLEWLHGIETRAG